MEQVEHERLGPYRLLRPLGRGGMGQVYAAIDERVLQEVAVKILLDPSHEARFLQEARALCQIDHPGVVRALTVGRPPPYLVMELLRGETLRAHVQREGRLSLSQVVQLGARLADAMAAVHAAGIVHRDLKPENIMLLPGLRPKIIDFGIARVPPPTQPLPDTLPETGAHGPRWLGTLTYMAPEQCRQAIVTDRADVYALGVVLYELLTGAPPFVSDDPVALAAHHLLTPPPLGVAPPSWRALLDQMLAKQPEVRPDMAAVRDHLGAARAWTPGRPVPFTLSRRTFVAGGLGAAAIAAAVRPDWLSGHPPGRASGSIDEPRAGNSLHEMVSPILLAQPVLWPIPESAMIDARGAPAATLTLAVPAGFAAGPQAGTVPPDYTATYQALQEQVREGLRPLLLRFPKAPLCYFGSAPVPLAVALGALVGTWQRVEVMQRHHQRREWTFVPAAQPARLPPLPEPPADPRPGDVILRVATSYPVDRAATLALCPAPLWEADLRLDALNPDAFGSSAEVAGFADAVKVTLDRIAQRLPGTRVVHLFAAVPAGLAFLIGTRLSPNMHRPVQTYDYQPGGRHVPALLLNQTGGSMDFQPLFRRFHEKIHLSYEGSAELRQMRDEVLNVLRQRLSPRRFTTFNQGSYEVGTGIKPPPGSDYDIDIGVVFPLERKRYAPLEVKGWVREAVHSMGTIEWKRPCITVQRRRHHLDIAVFVEDGGKRYLSWGKQNEQGALWRPDGLKEFMARVAERFPGQPDDSFQFRRVVQYLKRWKDVQFPREGVWAPTGCALTVAAYKWFRPRRSGAQQDDLGALQTLVTEVRRQLGQSPQLQFPEEPHDNVLRKMSAEQIKQMLQRLQQLEQWLDEAQKKDSTAPLMRAFGADFPER